MTPVPPSVACPTCGVCITVVDDICARCGRLFRSRELWERYEAELAGMRAARAIR